MGRGLPAHLRLCDSPDRQPLPHEGQSVGNDRPGRCARLYPVCAYRCLTGRWQGMAERSLQSACRGRARLWPRHDLPFLACAPWRQRCDLGCAPCARGRADRRRAVRDGRRDPLYDVPHSTAHVGVLRSGDALNIVPDVAELRFEFRTLPEECPRTMAEGVVGPGSITQAHRENEWIARSELDACGRFVDGLIAHCRS